MESIVGTFDDAELEYEKLILHDLLCELDYIYTLYKSINNECEENDIDYKITKLKNEIEEVRERIKKKILLAKMQFITTVPFCCLLIKKNNGGN